MYDLEEFLDELQVPEAFSTDDLEEFIRDEIVQLQEPEYGVENLHVPGQEQVGSDDALDEYIRNSIFELQVPEYGVDNLLVPTEEQVAEQKSTSPEAGHVSQSLPQLDGLDSDSEYDSVSSEEIRQPNDHRF